MRSRLWAVLGVLAMGQSPVAFAEEPAAEEIPAAPMPDFDVNSVLVSTFEAVQSYLEPEAERVRGLLEAALAKQYVVLSMNDVPAFEDYTAEVYLRSCPDGQYIGCVFVVGGRAQTDWVVGGQMSSVEGGYRVTLSFIHVADAKLKLDTTVDLDGTNDVAFQEGVLKIMDALVRGEVKELDTRGDPEAEARAKREEEERKRTAQQFTLDSTFEDTEVERGGDAPKDEGTGTDGHITADDLDRMEEKGGLPPWDRAGLTRSQYKLYRNSGTKLEDFKDRLLGRKGQILFRLSGGISSGPWGQFHDTWYLIAADAPADIRPRDVLDDIATQRQTRALSPGGQLEVDFGVARWMELGVFGGIRSAPYDYRFFKQAEGAVAADPPDPTHRSAVSWHAGARIGFIPFPAFPVRPTLHLGASYWSGNNLLKIVQVPTYLTASLMRPNNMVLVHVNPGAEVSLGKWVLLFTRFDLDIPVLGRNVQSFNLETKDPELADSPVGATDKGFGLGATLGVAVRIGVGPKRR